MDYSEDLEVQDFNRRYGPHDESHQLDSSHYYYQSDYSKDDPFVLESTVIVENVKESTSAMKLWETLGIDSEYFSVIEKNLLPEPRGHGLIAIVRFRNNMLARKFALFVNRKTLFRDVLLAYVISDCIGNIRELEIAYSKGTLRFPGEVAVKIVNVDLNMAVKELLKRFSSFDTISNWQFFVKDGCPQDLINIKFRWLSEALAAEFAINGKHFESDEQQMFAHVALDFVEGCRELIKGSFNEDTERAEIILPDNINVGFVNNRELNEEKLKECDIPDCTICNNF